MVWHLQVAYTAFDNCRPGYELACHPQATLYICAGLQFHQHSHAGNLDELDRTL